MRGVPLLVDASAETVNGTNYDKEHGVRTGAEGVEDEEEEVLVVSNSDAIVDPRAVVVHFDYASFTDAAMMRSIGFKRGTTTT